MQLAERDHHSGTVKTMKEEPSVTDGKRICSGRSPDARISEESSSKRLPAQQYGEHAFRERPTREAVFSNQYYLTTSGPICSLT